MPRPDLRYLFVVTYGRSGSTLLMGVLNTLPGYLIRGESRDALHHLFLFHRTGASTRRQMVRRYGRERLAEPTHPFFGAAGFPTVRALDWCRQLALDTLLRPQEDTRVTGFKEIRWYQPDLEEYVAWLREVFPGARFLVNTRDHAAVLTSKWWAKDGDKSEYLATIERRLLDLADSLGESAYHVHYDDYVANPAALRGLFAWLGEEFDEDAVRATLAVRHSV
ncbi:sulfotransferase [Nocardioides sp. T2.26MG-1]|uniref:sulfotransferase n=1 Tax=Nocardioides sp. T2.26MG-1 TaxID=3041166 RepID=UPI002477B31E|nr:sulfotransferase [Nocardioides sp. T2.26MG-1]CAI9405915.1 hypothetical protein HIDPHFAB_04480 [Nocardioides sp. T2.26MG-1]